MRGITLGYFLRRLGIFFLTIWIAATVIWLIPHLAPGDPVAAMVARMTSQSGFVENSATIIAGWKERFGLNDLLPRAICPLSGQHRSYGFWLFDGKLPDTRQRDHRPGTALDVGLLLIAITITFLFGNFLGAIMVWRRTPRLFKFLIPVGMMFTSLPSILAAIFLMYVFAFLLNWFPLIGSYDAGMQPGFNLPFIVQRHSARDASGDFDCDCQFWLLGVGNARHDDHR